MSPAPGIDPFLHTPARLGVMSLLAPADWVDFAFLRDSLDTSDSALSKQIAALEEAGYAEVRKERGGRRRTTVRMTRPGRHAWDAYIATLEQIVAAARAVPPAGPNLHDAPRPAARTAAPPT